MPNLRYIIVSVVIGVAVGLVGYTFIYAKGGSYLVNDPEACANCHIMQDHFDAWLKSSHKAVATCNSCHTPSAFIPKYLTKAIHGMHHGWAFTSGDFQEPIRITARNHNITEQACRTCHGSLVSVIDGPHTSGEPLSCIHCHRTVGHNE